MREERVERREWRGERERVERSDLKHSINRLVTTDRVKVISAEASVIPLSLSLARSLSLVIPLSLALCLTLLN